MIIHKDTVSLRYVSGGWAYWEYTYFYAGNQMILRFIAPQEASVVTGDRIVNNQLVKAGK